MKPALFHIIDKATWSDARQRAQYAPASFEVEGFIHLSRREQILRPANLLYHGRTDLCLLVIDPARLDGEVVMERGSHGEAELFPHLYGRLNIDAVDRVIEFPCNEDGAFTLPVELG